MNRRARSERSTRAFRRGQAAACVLGAAALLMASFAGSDLGEDRAAPGFVVIVNPVNPARAAGQEFLARAFFKRTTQWDHGAPIRPVDQQVTSPVRRAFSNAVLSRRPEAVRGYWLQRIFSGRDVPPPEVDSDAAVIRYVMSFPGGIGYISAATDPAPARVLSVQ